METTDMDEPITLNEYKKMKMKTMDSVDNLNNSSVFKKPFNVPVADLQDTDTDFSTSASRVRVNTLELNKSQTTLSLPPISMVLHNGFWQDQLGKDCSQDKPQFKNLENPIIVTCWSPLLLINNKLAFIGISPSNRMVKFTNIRKRHSRSIMSDTKGIVYLLYGPMYPKKDLPQYIRTKFTSGIPENWEELCSLWGYYLDMGCPKDFCWSDANTSLVSETDFIEKKPGKMKPQPLNGSLNCNNPSIANSCSIVNASTETSSTKSYTSVMLKKKITKLQAMLRTTLLRESMCSQHPDVTITNNTVVELKEHRNNGSQHPNPLQQQNNEQHVDSVPCSGDAGATPVLHKDAQEKPNDNTSINHITDKNVEQNQPEKIELGHGDNLQALPDAPVDIQQMPTKHVCDKLIIKNVRSLVRRKKKNNQAPITSARCSARLKMKRRKVYAKNQTVKKDNKLQPFIVENTTMITMNKKDLKTLTNTRKKSTMMTQVDLYHWRPVLSVEGDNCIMRIKGCDKAKLKRGNYVTEEICKRLSNYRVVDKAGVEYTLVGELTDPQNELPDSVKDGFKRGISTWWRRILHDHYVELMGNYTSVDSQNMTMSVSQLDLTVSKRGRRIVPRLNYWLGERVAVRAGETFIDRSTVQVLDENKIQKKGRNTRKSMNMSKFDSSAALTPQVKLIPLDESFVHEFPTEDRPIVMRSLKKTPGRQSKGSRTTGVELFGTTPRRADNGITPNMNAMSTLKNVTFGASLEKNDKENKEKKSKGGVLAGKVMKPKQRIRKQQLKVGNQFLHQICSLLKPKNTYEKTEIKIPSAQTSSQASVMSDTSASIFQNVLNGSYIPKKRKLFSMNNVDYQINDADQVTSTAAAPGAGAPRFTVTWNDNHCISGAEENFSEVSVFN